MPNRCENCNKFTALEFQEPEEASFEVECDKGDELHEGTLENRVAASEMNDAC